MIVTGESGDCFAAPRGTSSDAMIAMIEAREALGHAYYCCRYAAEDGRAWERDPTTDEWTEVGP